MQVTAREKAEAALRQLASGLEAKIRRLVGANIIGIIVFNIEGQIIEANEAFLRMVGCSREDLLSGRVRWTDLTPAEWRDWDEWAVPQLKATGIAQRPSEGEIEIFDGFLRKAGWRDASSERLAALLQQSGLGRLDRRCWTRFDFIEFDEGRTPPDFRQWELPRQG